VRHQLVLATQFLSCCPRTFARMGVLDRCMHQTIHQEQANLMPSTRLSALSTAASSPNLSPRSVQRVFHKDLDKIVCPPTQVVTRIPHSLAFDFRRYKLLLSVVMGATAQLCTRLLMPTSASTNGGLNEAPLTPSNLLELFQSSDHYLGRSGWHVDGQTFAPNQATGHLMTYNRSVISSAPEQTCDGVSDVQHVEMVLEGVSPTYVMEVLASPEYGVEWNPVIERVLVRTELYVDNKTDVAAASAISTRSKKDSLGRGKARRHRRAKASSRERSWQIIGQVAEVPIHPAVKSVFGGPRYSAGWFLQEYDCKVKHGFIIGTSRDTDVLTDMAGVTKGQELCMSAMLLAPFNKGKGTLVHAVIHVNPNVPRPFERLTLDVLGAGTRDMLEAVRLKAINVQAHGQHPYINCE